MIYRLHKKMLPLDKLKEKAQAYTSAGHLSDEEAPRVIRTIEQERGVMGEPNAMLHIAGGDGTEGQGAQRGADERAKGPSEAEPSPAKPA